MIYKSLNIFFVLNTFNSSCSACTVLLNYATSSRKHKLEFDIKTLVTIQ